MSEDKCQYIFIKGSKICGKELSKCSVTRKYCNKHLSKENIMIAYTVWNFTIKCNNGHVLVLREILIEYSPVFKAALDGNNDNIIELDYPVNIVYNIMYRLHDRFISLSNLEIPEEQNKIELLCKFIHQYDIKCINNILIHDIIKCISNILIHDIEQYSGEDLAKFIYTWMTVSNNYKMDLPEKLAISVVNFEIVSEWMEQDRKNSYKLMIYHKNIINAMLKQEEPDEE